MTIKYDTEKAATNVGSRYNMILVACERAREINEEREKAARKGEHNTYVYGPCVTAITEIENGLVGREYLQKLRR